MKLNLDALKQEIQDHLEAERFVVFHGFSRSLDTQPAVYWDTARYPDFRLFLAAARQAEVKLVVFHHREFTPDLVEDVLDRLEDSDLPPEERIGLERRVRDLGAYQGFTCAIQISFDFQGRLYLFDLHTDWYEEFLDTADEIDSLLGGEGEDDEGPIGGYFSRN